jgi:hypothetical protein
MHRSYEGFKRTAQAVARLTVRSAGRFTNTAERTRLVNLAQESEYWRGDTRNTAQAATLMVGATGTAVRKPGPGNFALTKGDL